MISIRNIAILVVFYFLMVSCIKESFYTGKNAQLRYSADTISFDTVFTSFGTAYQTLVIYNPYNESLNINSISLAGGPSSVFFININGISSSHISNIEIKPRDSLYIFLQVFINPIGQNLPLLIKDSIMFNINNNTKYILLEAFGQDVHLIKGSTLKSQTWPADKPYLIYGNVTVDTLQTLSISAGATVYFHRNANLRVKGTLTANGSFASQILFNDDRLDDYIPNYPGQWGGIQFLPGSTNNLLNYVTIKNGTSGIMLGNSNYKTNPDLIISNCIILNMTYSCLYAVNSKIKAWNCVIADAGTYTCGLLDGGDYQFYQCTLANYYCYQFACRTLVPALYISDYYTNPANIADTILNPLKEAKFYNTIIYDSLSFNATQLPNELDLDLKNSPPSTYMFNHCLIASTDSASFSSSSSFIKVIFNKNPKFENAGNFKFELDSLSPAIQSGDVQTGLNYPYDLNMVNRTLNSAPDIGAYQWVKK